MCNSCRRSVYRKEEANTRAHKGEALRLVLNGQLNVLTQMYVKNKFVLNLP